MDAKQFAETLTEIDDNFLCEFAEMLDTTRDFKQKFINAMVELDRCPRCGQDLKVFKIREPHGEWLVHGYCPTHKEDYI